MKFEKLTPAEVAFWESIIDGSEKLDPRCLCSKDNHQVLNEILAAAIENQFNRLIQFVAFNAPEIEWLCKDEFFATCLHRAYEHGVASGDAGCCCNLANIYHKTDGTGTQEEYAIAIELYQMGADLGDMQASVNLGYVYYYGRGCERDYAKAYECFARAAVMEDHPEALFKLGDLYAGGYGVRKNELIAWKLYSEALRYGEGTPFECRAAHHVADYLMTGIEGVLEPDPKSALELYCRAEISYYEAIDSGLDYYKGCLKQAIEGQAKAREAYIKTLRNADLA